MFTLIGDLPANAVGALSSGVNIMGYTELAPTTASSIADAIHGARVYAISYFDPESGTYKSFIPGFHDSGSDSDFTVTQGRAYFVILDGPASVYFEQATG